MVEGLHIGIIMDGNRRFAKKSLKNALSGHDHGALKFKELIDWSSNSDISKLTLYTLSIQNLERPKIEIDYLMNLAKKELNSFLLPGSIFEKYNLKITYSGRLNLLPEEIQELISKTEQLTKDNSGLKVNFCVAYGGKEEIVDAVSKIALDVKEGKISPSDVSSDLIDSYVYSSDEPDFIIRTGGDIRTSNFLVWQSTYSEWFFVEKFWPEFEKEDFLNCIDSFKKRSRRFGK